MPRPRDPFHQALASLRDRALSGVYPPGRPVVIVEEARRLRLSTTPVREALACLCGEGLMERASRAGYLAPRLDAALLRDRFWVRQRCLATSLELIAIPPDAGALLLSGAAPATVPDLFDRLIRATGNRALVEVYGRVDAQLRLLGDAEAQVLADPESEARVLLELAEAGALDALGAAVDHYHGRRMDAAPLLVLAVERRPVAPASNGAGEGDA